MSATPTPSTDMVTERLHALYLRVFAHLRRQPQHVVDVKAGKRPATFLKHRRDYWAMYEKGGDLRTILDGIDELRSEVATWAGCEMVGPVDDEHLNETKAQGRADVLVLVATRTDTEEALAKAYDAQAQHTHRSHALTKALGKRLAQVRGAGRSAYQSLGITPKGRAS